VRPGRAADHSPPSSGHGTVELYLYPPSGPHRACNGITLLLASISPIFRNFSSPPFLPRSTNISFSSLSTMHYTVFATHSPFSFLYVFYLMFHTPFVVSICIQFICTYSSLSHPSFRAHDSCHSSKHVLFFFSLWHYHRRCPPTFEILQLNITHLLDRNRNSFSVHKKPLLDPT